MSRKKAHKKILTILLIFALCITNYAAIVSDNDGSAFVTKAEFEALKENFEDQIENYNDSIDGKIDGAIAAYLAGIRLSQNTVLDPIISNYSDIRWMHGPYMYFTNRRFTEYTTTAGKYVDSVKWQVINPDNRRQTVGDGYLWWHDNVVGGFSHHVITFMLYPYNVPWAWGTGRNGQLASRGPSIFAAMEKETNGWAVYAKGGGFSSEKGHGSYQMIRPHASDNILPDGGESFGGVNNARQLYNTRDNSSMSLTTNTIGDGEIANYTINNIMRDNKASTTYTDGSIQSIVRKDWNPSFLTSSVANLWEGTNGYALKTACGYQDFMGDIYSRVGNSLVEDNRWKTETQFKGDMNNFIYSMWGTDVTSLGDTNVAPPLVSADYEYVDLSGSPNSVTVPFKVRNIGFSVQVGANGRTSMGYGAFQTHPTSTDFKGELPLTIPLFYRVKWADMLSGEFKRNGESLCKSDGFPLVENVDQAGEVKIKIKYEEKSQTDSSVVTLSPDQKIKTFFKNKPFTDTTGTYWKGYKKIDGTGDYVELNGTEWTDKEITVRISVKKGDSIWLRIDPLTSDGVYCQMTNVSCVFETE